MAVSIPATSYAHCGSCGTDKKECPKSKEKCDKDKKECPAKKECDKDKKKEEAK